MTVTLKHDVELSRFTSFEVGGYAKSLAVVENSEQLVEILESSLEQDVYVIGFGSNVLISDKGLNGLVIINRGGKFEFKEDKVIADSGAWWDDVVQESVNRNLWGIELLSKIPGSVGGALFINIAAYGQSIGESVEWIEVWDRQTKEFLKLAGEDLVWGYKSSVFQDNRYVIIRTCLNLKNQKTTELEYQKAISVAEEFDLDPENIVNRRKIIIEARARAGSIWEPYDNESARTVGSFFRNPIVKTEVAEKIMSYDETIKSKAEIRLMNKVHGGSSERVSAAHVLLASGFSRGQVWNNVKLNDKNLLKIEALPGATAQDIYNVAMEIQQTCIDKIGVKLEPEAQILGDFN